MVIRFHLQKYVKIDDALSSALPALPQDQLFEGFR